jgi:hypothetical protein
VGEIDPSATGIGKCGHEIDRKTHSWKVTVIFLFIDY